MVGFCGVIGKNINNIDLMIKKLIYLGNEKSYVFSDSNVRIASVFFDNCFNEQPIETKDGSLFWIWGNINEHSESEDFNNMDDIKYCCSLYNKYGLDFVKKLNGEFSGIIYKPKQKLIHLFTDRLCSHPIFYTITKDNELVFSTNIQSIPLYPSIKVDFNLEYLTHFFTFERVIGIKTVFNNVDQIHPGSILSYDIKTGKKESEIYWTPKYIPKKRSDSQIVSEFINLLKNIFIERIDPDLTYGLYLSGGSDSRLILSMIKKVYPEIKIICYHMNELMNREAKIAKKVAEACNSKFVFLKRDENFLIDVLKNFSPISLYKSWFDHAHFITFNKITSKEVDVMIHGFYSDTILKREQFLLKSIKIPIINQNLYLPFFHKFKSFENFLRLYCEGYGATGRGGKIPDYLINRDMNKIYSFFKNELIKMKNGIKFNDVYYHSLEDFFHWWGFYPLTNSGYSLYYSEIQYNKSFTPFLDNKIIDFTLSIPDDFQIRNDLINLTISSIDKKLSKIPHAGSNLPIKYPKLFHFYGNQFNSAKQKIFSKQNREGPWQNTEEFLRKNYHVKDIIYNNKKLVKHCEFFDWKKLEQCYLDHISGKNNTLQLIPILTFLDNKITKFVVNNG